MSSKPTQTPSYLGPSAAAWYAEVVASYDIDTPHHRKLLQLAAEALDRCEAARQQLAKDGLFVEGRQGRKPHPAAAIARDSTIIFARLVRELRLDEDDTDRTARPPALRHSTSKRHPLVYRFDPTERA